MYLREKYTHEMQLENYAMDCLRAMGQWKEPPPRYFDLQKPVQKVSQKTGDEIMQDLLNKFKKGR